MFSCKKAAQLCSKSQDVQLSLIENFNLRFHMMMCRACRHFHDNTATLRKLMRSFSEGGDQCAKHGTHDKEHR